MFGTEFSNADDLLGQLFDLVEKYRPKMDLLELQTVKFDDTQPSSNLYEACKFGNAQQILKSIRAGLNDCEFGLTGAWESGQEAIV